MALPLYKIEREVARRTGPYALLVSTGAGAGQTFRAKTLVSSIDLGGVTSLYVLRRNRKTDGTAVAGFDADDRVRRAAAYNNATGEVTVDNSWEGPTPAANEEIELTHLHPDDELRPAVVAGLWRCWFTDRTTLTLASAASERNLTTDLPWLTTMGAFKGALWNYPNSLTAPKSLQWYRAYQKLGGLWLSTIDPYPNQLVIVSRRPHASYFQPLGTGAYAASSTGPTDDDDTFTLDVGKGLAYAAAAGHIEAWRLASYRLIGPASAGRQLKQEDAANEFTLQAAANYSREDDKEEDTIKFSSPFAQREVQRA